MNAPAEVPQTPPYVSPYGKLPGLTERLASLRRTLGQSGYRFVGTGPIADLELAMRLLNLKEYAEWMIAHGSPEQVEWGKEIIEHQGAVELLGGGPQPAREIEELIAGEKALTRLEEAIKDATNGEFGTDIADLVQAVETLAEESKEGAAIRQVLIDVGALAVGDPDTDVAALVRALLS
jgi:hypothetical protein